MGNSSRFFIPASAKRASDAKSARTSSSKTEFMTPARRARRLAKIGHKEKAAPKGGFSI
jgi:hypothetical protein